MSTESETRATKAPSHLQESVRGELCELARRHGVRKVVLFGSRARGDAKRTSDIDLAVYGGNAGAFAIDAEEGVNTLLRFDCVDMAAPVAEDLKESIEREGVVIYEKSA